MIQLPQVVTISHYAVESPKVVCTWGPSSWAAATVQLLCTRPAIKKLSLLLYTSREKKLHRRPNPIAIPVRFHYSTLRTPSKFPSRQSHVKKAQHSMNKHSKIDDDHPNNLADEGQSEQRTETRQLS